MKKFYFLLLALLVTTININAQTLEELKAKKTELAAKAAEAQATADALAGEINGLQGKIDIMSGWMTGFAGNVGFDLNKSNNWAAAPNPNASSTGLGIALTAFANKMTDKTMLRNKGILNKAWQKVKLDGEPVPLEEEKGLFESGTVDILNLSSLYGYRIHPKVAISALGELNTSIENFLQPGTFDIGVGATWTPSNNLVVVVHPLNYHIAWPADGSGFDQTGAIGAKIRADYTNTYVIGGKNFGLSSTFTTFMPYTEAEAGTPGLFEYTWLNSISFELFKGIGVGVGIGLRGADFEIQDKVQNFYNVGLSYNL